jgi:excisionase family DNA binding protein
VQVKVAECCKNTIVAQCLGIKAVCCFATLVDMNNHQGPPPRPTIKQAAEYHHMDIKTVRRWIQQGRITAHRVGPRLLRLDRDSVSLHMGSLGGTYA